MGLLLFAKTRTEIRRLHRESFQDCHDYNYVLYRTTYKNNRAMQMTLLLSMAKYQLLMHCPDQASQALRQLSPERLNKSQLKSYYLYRAAAEFLLQDSIWRDDLDACHLVPVEKAAMNAQELEEAPAEPSALETALTFVDQDAAALVQAIGEPLETQYEASCSGPGDDGVWTYDGFTVYTYRENSVETIVDAE